jgi:hypothetical protein
MKSSIKGGRKRTEQSYVRRTLTALRRLGIPCAWEAALLGRSVDLTFVQDQFVCTVEFKKTDWRRAIKQAHDHRLGADFAFVCIAERAPSLACREAAERAGVGIFGFRPEQSYPLEVVLPAPRSSETWCVARERLIEQMRYA